MQATAESMHYVALATMPRPARDLPPPEGMPQDNMHPCQTCGAACYGDQCRPCWLKEHGMPAEGATSSAYKRPCANCGQPCQGTVCRACYFKSRRKNATPKGPLPICAEPGCGKTLSTHLATHCRKHAARVRRQPEREPRAEVVRVRQCQPGNSLHAMTGQTCTCGAFRAIALAVPA